MKHKPLDADPGRGTYYPLLNRTAGSPGEFPFGNLEKEQFLRLLKKLYAYYTIDVLAWQVMGNHFHFAAFAPAAFSMYLSLIPPARPHCFRANTGGTPRATAVAWAILAMTCKTRAETPRDTTDYPHRSRPGGIFAARHYVLRLSERACHETTPRLPRTSIFL